MVEDQMKQVPQFSLRKLWAASLLSSLLMMLMHPFVFFGIRFPDGGILAWIHLVPILVLGYHLGFRQKFFYFFVTGFVGHLGILYWLLIAMQRFGGFNTIQSFFSLTALVLVLTLFFALPLVLACWVNRFNKISLFILVPIFMLCRDYGLSRIPFQGFPWALPVYSQGHWLSLFQWVDWTGPLGISFYIYLVNGLFAESIVFFLYKRQLDKMVSRLLVIFVLSLFSLYFSFLSGHHYEKTVRSQGSIRVALVQGNIPQERKWDPFQVQENLHRYLFLSGQAIKNGAELLLWPESAYPYGLNEVTLFREKFLDQNEMSIPLFFGANAYRHEAAGTLQFNGIFSVNTHAAITEKYYKIHLVPFGEYLPFAEYLSYFSDLVKEIGSFTPGTEVTLFDVKNFKFGSLICFEDVFSEVAVNAVRAGADVLVNYTNDAWYGDSSAQYQHLVFSRFRALETRRPVLRVTNTGVTAVINAKGEVLEELPPFRDTTLLSQIKVEGAESWYVRHGEPWASLVVTLAGLIFIHTFGKWILGPLRQVD